MNTEIEKIAEEKYPLIEYINPDNDFEYELFYETIKDGIEQRRNDFISGYELGILKQPISEDIIIQKLIHLNK